MLNKKYIADYISTEFPDLKNTEFNFNNLAISAFTERTLLPFLIYQNTVDSKNRIIELYLQENSASIHFLPFYTAVGFYRKAVNTALTAARFKTEKFAPNQKSVRFNSSICSVTGINFISRTIQLRSGISEHELAFEEDYKLKWDNYKNSADLRERLRAFSLLDKASKQDIFTLPLKEAGKSHEGVILFSSVSKFTTLLKNLKVAGHDLRQHLNIQSASFSDEAIKLNLISSKKTQNQPVTILVARNDSLMAFNQIIEAGKGDVDHLNTVIIDDFDELLLGWERSGKLPEMINELRDIYFNRLGSVIKDIYLVCKNRNFSIRRLLEAYGIPSLPWQISPAEKIVLDNLDVASVKTHIFPVSDSFLESCHNSIDKILSQWKDLGRNYFCNGQTIRQIGTLYSLREKLQSFFQPNGLLSLISRFENELSSYQTLWFSNDQDAGLIKATIDILALVKAKALNYGKISGDILRAADGADLKKGLSIVTNNNSPEDRIFFDLLVRERYPETEVIFYTVKELIQSGARENSLQGLILLLSWNKDLLNHLLTNLAAEKQVFIVSKKSSLLIMNHLRRASADLEHMTDSTLQYDLLNLKPGPEGNPADYSIVADTYDEVDEAEQFTSGEPEELSVYVDKVLDFFNGIDKRSEKKGAKTCFVYFEDGSQVEWAENKSVFYFDEHADEGSDSVQKEARLLTRGDLVLLPKNRSEMKTILRNALIQDKNLSSDIRFDDEWRKQISTYILEYTTDIDRFRDDLNTAGFPVVNSGTIRNWIEGETIQPHNFRKLLLTLISMNVLSEDKRDQYYRSNKTVKSQKVMFVRIAVKKLIFSLRGIHYGDDGIFDQKLINGFLDHIDIKPVLGIYCK